MILIVDDEIEHLERARAALAGTGHDVHAFTSGSEALQFAARHQPDLVLSDVRMPDLDGPAFKRAYDARFPGRSTPFVFLTALADAGDIVFGLDSGADDYIVKGTPDVVLDARVRAALRRRVAAPVPLFRGDLKRFAGARVLQFCELNGFTGKVDFEAPGFAVSVAIRSGQVQESDAVMLGRLYDLAEGEFVIRAEPAQSDTLVADKHPAERPPAPPMGRLSSVRVRDRVFQIQTEAVHYPSPQVSSVVILNGESVLKRAQPLTAQMERAAVERLIREQHALVEAEVRDRLAALARSRTPAQPDQLARYYTLFEDGLEAFRRQDYQQALACWREANGLNPADRSLEVNIRVAEARRVRS